MSDTNARRVTAHARNLGAFALVAAGVAVGALVLGGVGTTLALTTFAALTAVFVAASGRAKNTALVVFSLILTLALGEFALRLPAVEEDVATQWGRGRVQHFSTPVFAPHPELGFDAIPGVAATVTSRHHDRLVYEVTYSFDEHGARHTPGGTRAGEAIVVAGDSFNFGEGLNDNQTLAYHLQSLSHQQFWALNIARPGYGLHQVLRQLELEVPAHDGADSFAWIVVSLVDNHIERVNGRYSWMRGTPRYVLDRQGRLARRGVFGDDGGPSWQDRLKQNSRLVAAFERLEQRIGVDDDDQRFVAVLHAINENVERKYHAHCLFLYHSGAAFQNDLVGRRDRMHRLFAQAGIDYIDVNESIPDIDASYFIDDDGHPSEKLNIALAGLVLRHISEVH